jgi:hypothetical protein
MATNLTSTTFLSEYNDDFRDSDHYHRILFNNGRALQARELTQSQTIIQQELGRLSKFIVNEGAIFNNSGNLASGVNAFSYTYLKVNSLPVGYAQLKGTEINDGDLFAIVKEVLPAAGSDPDTIFVKMTKGQSGGASTATNTTVSKPFAAGATLTTSLGNITIQSVNDAVGKASIAEVPQFDTFAANHLVMVEAQTLVLSKYSPDFTGVIGFKVTEDIVTTADNIALFDNSGSTPNLTSPGADRLRIVLTLTTKDNVAASDTFYEVYRVRNGQVSLVKTPDKILSRIGNLIDARTYSQTGNFIEQSSSGEFDLTIEKDSDDDFLSFKVSGGTAFVNGSRVERDFNLPIRVAKPRNLISDLKVKTSEKVGANIGNYVVADSAYGLVGYIEDVTQVNLYTAVDRGGSNIGTARVRGLYTAQSDYRIHLFDIQLTNPSANGIGDVRSIGVDAANYANLKAIQNRYDIYNKEENTLLFKLPNSRVQEVSSVTAVIGTVYTTNKTASTVVINAGTDTFTETDDWIYQVDGDGELTTPTVVLSGGNTQATISGPDNGAGHVIAYQNKTLTRKNKSLKPSTAANDWESETIALSNGVFTLAKADIFRFYKVTDATTNEDITYKFVLDNGQRDNFYGPGKGTLKSGVAAPAGNVTVQYKYFEHSTPSGTGYFAGAASYGDVTFSEIPKYTTTLNQTIHLADVIDMRPLQNPANETFSGGIARIEDLPKNQSTLSVGTAKYWLPRNDVLTLTSAGTLGYHQGASSYEMEMPTGIPRKDMPLYNISLNPFTFNEEDLNVTRYDNRGFKMEDLRNLENRLSNVERISTLTLLEAQLASLEVYDPDDATFIRQTEGITGDNFDGVLQADWSNDDYRATLQNDAQQLLPLYFNKSIGLTYDSDLSLNTCVIKGNNIWPTYTEVVADFGQEEATGVVPVNQFDIPQSIGSAELTPDGDYWTNKRVVDKSYSSQSNSSLLPDGTTEISSQGTITISTGAAY